MMLCQLIQNNSGSWGKNFPAQGKAAAAGSGELGTGTTTQSPWGFSPRFYLLSLNDKPFRSHLVIFHICIITISHICDIDYSRPLLSGTVSRPYYHAGTNIKHRPSSVDFVKIHQWKQYCLLLLWKTSSGSKTNPTILTRAPAPISIRTAFCRTNILETRLQQLQSSIQTAPTIQEATLRLLLSNESVDRSHTHPFTFCWVPAIGFWKNTYSLTMCFK